MNGYFSRAFALQLILLIALFLAFGGKTATADTPSLDDEDDYFESQPQLIADPLEPWNRAVFHCNDFIFEHMARPAYKGYVYVTPSFMRTGIKNFFHNLAFPVRFVNNLLQGKGRAAGVEMSRFILNTTAGLGGLFNVAQHHQPVVPVEDADFGQTLGIWGFGEGFYIVWPLIGSSSLRDTTGLAGDYFLTPINYLSPWYLGMGVEAGKAFNELDDILDLYDDFKRVAIEPYSSMRDAYVQYRRAKIHK